MVVMLLVLLVLLLMGAPCASVQRGIHDVYGNSNKVISTDKKGGNLMAQV